MIGLFADIGASMRDPSTGSDVSAYEKVMSAFMITVTRNLTNKSYLAGMQQLIEVFQDPDAKADRVARALAGNFVPNILSHAQSAGGDVELKEVRNLWDALQKKIPGAASGLDARRNIIGEPYEAEGFEKSPLQLLNPFNPIAFSTKTGAPVLEEMANLHHGFTPPSPKLNGMLDLREHDAGNGRTAYDRWMELRSQVKVGGKTLRQALESLFKSRSYKALDPRSEPGLESPRIRLARRVLSDYRERALRELLKELPQLNQLYKQTSRARSDYRQGAPYESALERLQQQ